MSDSMALPRTPPSLGLTPNPLARYILRDRPAHYLSTGRAGDSDGATAHIGYSR